MYHVLIIEDDKLAACATKELLEMRSCRCDLAYDVEDAYSFLENYSYDFIILDLMLPGEIHLNSTIKGLEILKTIRAAKITTPIIIPFDKPAALLQDS